MKEKITKRNLKENRHNEKVIQKEKQMRNKQLMRFSLYSLVALLIIGSIYWMASLAKNSDENTNTSSPISNKIEKNDWAEGNKKAKVVVIEYGDFQCPSCKFFAPLIRQAVGEFGDDAIFVYRYFPLPMHKNAKLAAYTAEAAGAQDNFWEMYNLLFENQETWAESDTAKDIFIGYAKSLNLNMKQFKKDLTSSKTANRVNENVESGKAAEVSSTPSFFINGEITQLPENYEGIKNTLSKAINENK